MQNFIKMIIFTEVKSTFKLPNLPKAHKMAASVWGAL